MLYFLIGELFVFLSFFFQAPHHKGAGSEGEDVPVRSEGDGYGCCGSECFKYIFKQFHFFGAGVYPGGCQFFDWWV